MNCQTKLRINHLTAVKSVAILESNDNLNFYTRKKNTLFFLNIEDLIVVSCILEFRILFYNKIMPNYIHCYELSWSFQTLPWPARSPDLSQLEHV
ncbi:hypothetical protein TNCV_2797941 [Trichonephila clavipes]|nr:hypothetical protein TNCV_2797941 [Trichonephila clavipes]